MFNAVTSIAKYIEEQLQSLYGFSDPGNGVVQVEDANRYDVNAGIPAICINDTLWEWDNSQYGSMADQICTLYTEVLAGSKAESLKLATQLGGHELPGSDGTKGILLRAQVPLLRFMDGSQDHIGTIEFDKPTVRYILGFDEVSKNVHNYQLQWNIKVILFGR